MRVRIVAVGRLRGGPERELVDDYLTRFDKTGRLLGLGPSEVIEVEDRKKRGPSAEADLIGNAVPQNAAVCALDERGSELSSSEFANQLRVWQNRGHRDLAFLIGGASGLDKLLLNYADMELSLGRMVWPHMLARVMLAEQLYRAATILAGSPYHRE